jgi:hypothetical protein
MGYQRPNIDRVAKGRMMFADAFMKRQNEAGVEPGGGCGSVLRLLRGRRATPAQDVES